MFAVSPTLSKNPKLLWSAEHVMMAAPDIREHPVDGDIFTWQIRFAYDNTFGWTSEESVQDFFAQANKEIDQAFADGRLHHTKKLKLSRLLVPKSAHDAEALVPSAFELWSSNILYRLYQPTHSRNSSDATPENIKGQTVLYIDTANPNPQVFPEFTFEQGQRVARWLFWTYRVIGLLALALSLIAVFVVIARCFRRKHAGLLMAIVILCLYAYSWIYCYSIEWFGSFLHNEYFKFFYAGCVAIPFIDFGMLLGVGLMVRLLAQRHSPQWQTSKSEIIQQY